MLKMVGTPSFCRTGANVLHRPVEQGGKAEADSQLVQTLLDLLDLGLDIDAQRGKHVGRTATAADGPIAVLGHRHAGGSSYQGGRRTDIERAQAISAGSARIDQRSTLSADGRHFSPHRNGRAGNLGHRQPLLVQSEQKPADLLVRAAAVHDQPDGLGNLVRRQILPGLDTLDGGFDHQFT